MPENSPTEKDLLALLSGDLSEQDEQRLSDLIADSPDLQARLDELAGASEFRSSFEPDNFSNPDSEESKLPTEISTLIADIAGQPPLGKSRFIGEPDRPPPDTPSHLGHFEIEKLIAAGGMGLVFKAHDPDLNRTVAIKSLSPALSGCESSVQRFLREATAAAAIEHPNIIPIYTIDRVSAAQPFIVMRYVAGGTVEDLLRASKPSPLPEDTVIRVARSVAAGLAAAHAKNVTHRDIKPSNILIEDDTSIESLISSGDEATAGILLTDFGLARAAEASALTHSGVFLGTPQFASPEQARGDESDHRSDLYSLGAVLYFMATGKPCFEGDSIASILYRIVHEPHRPAAEVNPALSPWLAEVVDRLLAKDPADRYQAAADLLFCLENRSSSPPEESRAIPGVKRRTAIWTSFASFAAVVLAGGLFWHFYGDRHGNGMPAAFSIVGSGTPQLFSSFPEAVSAAKSGDVIEIGTNETISLDTAVEVDKFLTIRAAPAAIPILTASGNHSHFSVAAPLLLEGLTLIQPASPGSSPPFLFAPGAPVVTANCLLVREDFADGRAAKTQPLRPFVTLQNSQATFLRCEILGPDSALVVIRSGGGKVGNRILVRNCVTVLAPLVYVSPKATGTVDLTVEHSALFNKTIAALPGENALLMNIQASRNVLDLLGVFNITSFGRQTQNSSFSWEGIENLFSVELKYILTSQASRKAVALIPTDLKGWQAMGDVSESRSIEVDQRFRNQITSQIEGNLSEVSSTEFMEFDYTAIVESGNPGSDFSATGLGPELSTLGPGEAYHQFRETPEYEAWSAEIREELLDAADPES